MVGSVAGGIMDAHSTSNSSNLGSGVSHHTESATWDEEKVAVLVLDIVQQ